MTQIYRIIYIYCHINKKRTYINFVYATCDLFSTTVSIVEKSLFLTPIDKTRYSQSAQAQTSSVLCATFATRFVYSRNKKMEL